MVKPSQKLEEVNETGVYYAPWEKNADRIITPFEKFVHRQSASSLCLVVATLLALLFANTSLSQFYYDLTHIKLGISLSSHELKMSLHHWVNDGLMALFFFVIGLELKREILVGELASLKKAALPIIAALGGMVVPALIYLMINSSNDIGIKGWGVPMATDIAFAIGVMILLGDRIPRSLMAFLIALAIADDLGAVIVIALFYTESISIMALSVAGLFTVFLAALNLSGVRSPIPYFLIAVCLWFAMLSSGIHATLAGVIGAFSVPAKPKFDPKKFLDQNNELLETFIKSYQVNNKIITNISMKSIVHSMEELLHSVMTPLQRLEHIWHMPVAFFVLPVFAFFNAGIFINTGFMSDNETLLVFLGVSMGLILGKFIGVAGASWLAIKLNIAQLPNNTNFSQVAGASFLAGIGFTMSIFVAQLAFNDNYELLNSAKIAILFASVISASLGYFWLKWVGHNRRYGSGSELS